MLIENQQRENKKIIPAIDKKIIFLFLKNPIFFLIYYTKKPLSKRFFTERG